MFRVSAVIVAAVLAISLHAQSNDLKYTEHIVTRKFLVAKPATPSAEESLTLTPATMLEGPVDVVHIVSLRGLRIEYVQGAGGLAAGTVVLNKPDGSQWMLNTADHTYWKVIIDTAGIAEALAAEKAAGVMSETKTTVTHSGEFATIVGAKCERVTLLMTSTMKLPELSPQVAELMPQDLLKPLTVQITTELWLENDRYKVHAALEKAVHDATAKASGMAAVMSSTGTGGSDPDGIVMRRIIRSQGDGKAIKLEMESIVTAISEFDAPASLFEIPADYRQVPPPHRGGL